ncbi:MAG: hypothetical protein MUF54_18110 [Polyangiaceae bacterium]|jgi:hypothetical protein|nr:hypothetical protein [Polyangiaceae bacterium]
MGADGADLLVERVEVLKAGFDAVQERPVPLVVVAAVVEVVDRDALEETNRPAARLVRCAVVDSEA